MDGSLAEVIAIFANFLFGNAMPSISDKVRPLTLATRTYFASPKEQDLDYDDQDLNLFSAFVQEQDEEQGDCCDSNRILFPKVHFLVNYYRVRSHVSSLLINFWRISGSACSNILLWHLDGGCLDTQQLVPNLRLDCNYCCCVDR